MSKDMSNILTSSGNSRASNKKDSGTDGYITIVYTQSNFIPVRMLAQKYFCTETTVRRNLKAIENLPRYKSACLYLNEDGDKLVNDLIYFDYLEHKSVLKEKNLAKHLPEFSMASAMERRGDFKKLVRIGE